MSNLFKTVSIEAQNDYVGGSSYIDLEYQGEDVIYIDIPCVSIEITLEEAKKLRDFLTGVLV